MYRSAGPVLLLGLLLTPLPALAVDGGIESLRQSAKAFAAVAEAVSPSVVNIQAESRSSTADITEIPLPFGDAFPFGDDLFERFFGERSPKGPRQGIPRRSVGHGSGFVFESQQGLLADKTYLLTNDHVVAEAETVRVTLQDGREFEAEITGRDPQSDVAVIEIPTGGIPPLKLADSADLYIGEWVIAIGNPFGLSHTVTVGVVSAKGRTTIGINDYEDFIQTDAAINPGNSGGPLVNLDGKVVGMNTAIVSRSGGYMGVGFAIPSNLLRSVANQLIDTGDVTRGYLGIVIQQLTPDLAEWFGLDQRQGILVAQVADDSPAARGGLRQGDLITAYQGEPVVNVGAFRNRVALTPPGTEAEITIVRDGRSQTLRLRIGELTQDKLAATTSADAGAAEVIGLNVQALTPEVAEQFDAKAGEGVVVTRVEPGSVAALAGIDVGTVILQVNREPVQHAAGFKQAIEQSPKDRALLLIRQGGTQRFLVLDW